MNNPIVVPMTVASDQVAFDFSVSEDVVDYSLGLATAINVSVMPVATYDGDYIIIPKAEEEQVMATNGLMMTDDVTIREVPYFETSNLTGTTVYIASEV